MKVTEILKKKSNETETLSSKVKIYHNPVINYFIHIFVICSRSLSKMISLLEKKCFWLNNYKNNKNS